MLIAEGRVQVAARALQLHPTEPGLWARVALWEWEVNSDAAAARVLIQRGLRACPRAASLWADYFQLELLFARKLAARRQVLGLPLPHSTLRESAGGPAALPLTVELGVWLRCREGVLSHEHGHTHVSAPPSTPACRHV